MHSRVLLCSMILIGCMAPPSRSLPLEGFRQGEALPQRRPVPAEEAREP